MVNSPYQWVDQEVGFTTAEWSQWSQDLHSIGNHRYRASLLDVGPHVTKALMPGPKESVQESMRAHGYLELHVPETYTTWEMMGMHPLGGEYVEVSQGTDPVPVLLHPSEVNAKKMVETAPYTTFINWNYTDTAAVTLSTEKAENEWKITLILETLTSRWTEANQKEKGRMRRDIAAFVENPDSVMAVLAYLGRASASVENVETLNSLLSEMGHAIRLTTTSRGESPPPRSD